MPSISKLLDLPGFLSRDRAGWGIRLTLGSLIFVKLFTFNLWTSERAFPHAPVADWVPALPAPLDSLLLLGEMILMGSLLLFPQRNKWLPLFFVILLCWVLPDQVRLQPWYYLYALLLVPAWLYKAPERETHNNGALLCMQVVVIGLYSWSGIHKHSHDFYNYVHGFISKPLEPYLPATVYEWVVQLGVVAPWFELAAGLLLIFKRTRNLAVFMIAGMHGYLLLCLGPLGSGWNAVIWPWNISMVLLVWTLFYKSEPIPWKTLLEPRVRRVSLPIVLLALVMPALRFADAWDNSLSFCLYSGKTQGLTLFVTENSLAKLPEEARQHFKPSGTEHVLFMPGDTWSMDAVGVPIYPEPRVYKTIGKALCDRYFDAGDFAIMIKRRPRYIVEGETCKCEEL